MVAVRRQQTRCHTSSVANFRLRPVRQPLWSKSKAAPPVMGERRVALPFAAATIADRSVVVLVRLEFVVVAAAVAGRLPEQSRAWTRLGR